MLRTRTAVLAAATTLLALLSPVGPAAAETDAQVHTDEVCLPTHNPGDEHPQSLYGVRYWTRPITAHTRTIVLVHGAGATPAHEYWDLAPDFSAARNLARAGYLVLAYDRLGYERSPYRTGTGRQINASGGQEMLHDVVTDVRTGAWTVAARGACDATRPGPGAGAGAGSVIVAGSSLGGGIVSGYPGRFHDVAAAIPVGFTNNGLTPDFLSVAGPHVAEAEIHGSDRTDVETTEAECARVFLYQPGVAPAGKRMCQRQFPSIPIGDVEQFPALYPINLAAIREVGPGVPVLLAFNDHDEAFTAEQAEAEFAYWQASCGCDVETWTQRDAGHAPTAHRTMPTFTAKVVDWLAAKNLKP